MTQARWANGRRGVTLTDVLLATVILGLALLPLVVMFQSSMGRVRISRPELMGALVAAEIMDQVRLLPYPSLPFSPRLFVLEADDFSAPPVQQFLVPRRVPLVVGRYPARFEVAVTAEEVSESALAKVTVRVSWRRVGTGEPEPAEHVLTEWVEDRLARNLHR